MDITIYNRETDQAMVWAYLCGMNDVVFEKEEQYVNMIFTQAPTTAHPSMSQPAPKKKTSVAAARQQAQKQVERNITGRVKQLRSSRKRS